MNPYQPISHQIPSYGQIQPIYQPKSYAMQDPKYPIQMTSQNPQLLGESSLKVINQQMNLLQKDIHQNNKQIRALNNKITRSDFENSQLKKLFEKQHKLHQKRQQYEEILKNHQFLKQQMLNNKLKQSQIKHSLGQEYQSIMESRRRMEKQQKEKEKQEELSMINLNKQAQIYQRQRKRQIFQQQKRLAQQELRQKEQVRQRERQQKINEKSQYNQILNQRNHLQTQKDHVYRQYYNHFQEEQDKLQAIYKQKAMESDFKKEKQRQQQQIKQYETFQMKMGRQNQEKLRKITQERESLKNFLQSQIEQSQKRKTRQKQEQFRYQNQVKSYQTNLSSYEMIEREKKRQMQKRYDQELSSQINVKNRLSLHQIEQAHRSSSLGRSQNFNTQRKTHNPVTNPIDFKIGITNPYLIKEYENTKQKYMGDNNLKLRNLAMIGNNSLMTSRY